MFFAINATNIPKNKKGSSPRGMVIRHMLLVIRKEARRAGRAIAMGDETGTSAKRGNGEREKRGSGEGDCR